MNNEIKLDDGRYCDPFPLFKSRYYAKKRREEIYSYRDFHGQEQSHIRVLAIGDKFALWDCSQCRWLS